jgi:hypothetical protein
VSGDRLAGQPCEDPLELALYRPTFALALPADKPAAVELHHREKGRWHRAGI